ncbi:hypothetical protein [Minwuia thermotolerans]|uniref:hypothetical protein n=1 Tax=Minwuia thermotolerans TaxID=2056226 RepID=UPI0013DE5878|nr:hypothetical protein [Minwuia thermotolerans]
MTDGADPEPAGDEEKPRSDPLGRRRLGMMFFLGVVLFVVAHSVLRRCAWFESAGG